VARRPGYTILVHRDGVLASRQLHVPLWVVRTLVGIGALGLIGVVVVAALYGPIVTAAARVPVLEREAAGLRAENARVTELAQRLDEAEARYAHLRGMLGGGVAIPELRADSGRARPAADEPLYVAPPIVARTPRTDTTGEPAGPSVPHLWPLSASSYRTRGLAQGDPLVETHAGLDLAVPVGSEVRAAGGGLVRRTGTDSAYGEYVLLAHPEGYETMYGHLSRVFVTTGTMVGAGQLVALSGNSGRSTAPHLHFEVRRNGRSVDPTSLVREGR
jgi:murein DD-endopeptidase MepM/ murein hydrolase activator NlpD